MTGWTPLYQQIIGSSIWEAPDHVRIAWITLLAVCNKEGVASVTTSGLARLANISAEHAENAIAVLSGPDPDTLTQANEGRRIARCEDGWKLLNFQKYRDKAKKAALREYNAAKQAEYRAGKCSTTHIRKPVKTTELTDENKVYDLYPRKVGRPSALKKITIAIAECGLETVLESTRVFAEAWKGESDLTFCPHPATWFGQKRFNDDPATYSRNAIGKSAAGAQGDDNFWKDKARFEMIEKEIKAIENRASHTAMDMIVEPRDVDRYHRLKTERKELKTKMNL